jgi:hypothetical protein
MKGAERIRISQNPEEFVERAIARFVTESAANRRKVDGGRYWEEPLVGFAAGDDPLFKQYKKIIGRFHRPGEESRIRRDDRRVRPLPDQGPL